MAIPRTQEELEEVLRGLEGEPSSLTPVVIVNKHVEASRIAKFWCGDVYIKQEEVNGLLKTGWIIVRIQTEFQGLDLGFHTMVYMVKTAP